MYPSGRTAETSGEIRDGEKSGGSSAPLTADSICICADDAFCIGSFVVVTGSTLVGVCRSPMVGMLVSSRIWDRNRAEAQAIKIKGVDMDTSFENERGETK